MTDKEIYMSLHNYHDLNKKWHFYYDETGNLRTFNIKKGSFNNQDNKILTNTFCLGGIVSDKNIINEDFDDLFKKLKLQPTMKEIKVNFLIKKEYNFLEMINTKRAADFLEYVNSNNFLVHFSITNFFYLSIADIIDTIILNISEKTMQLYCHIFGFDRIQNYVLAIKSAIFNNMNNDISYIENLFYQYNYPNIHDSDLYNFYNDISIYLSKFNDKLTKHFISLIKSIDFEKSFFQEEESHILIKDFAHIYINFPTIFDKSIHHFDEENTIKPIVDTLGYTNVRWYVSDKYPIIQISDCIIGLIDKYVNFIETNDFENVLFDIIKLDKESYAYKSYKNLIDILNKSKSVEPAFYFMVTDDMTKVKLDRLLDMQIK